jgi:hypothetical protein
MNRSFLVLGVRISIGHRVWYKGIYGTIVAIAEWTAQHPEIIYLVHFPGSKWGHNGLVSDSQYKLIAGTIPPTESTDYYYLTEGDAFPNG